MAQHGYLGEGYGARGDQGDPESDHRVEARLNPRDNLQSEESGLLGRDTNWRREEPHRLTDHSHYLAWRDRQLRQFDEEYADYCREREQQFREEFESWRRNRQPGVTSGPEEELLLSMDREISEASGEDAATLNQSGEVVSRRRR